MDERYVARADPSWLAVALALALVQFPLLALRWRYIAARLGLHFGFGHALGEYWLSSLVNQVLPFGVMGDGLRAVRHARRAASVARVVLALVCDRISGQLALWLVLLATAHHWLFDVFRWLARSFSVSGVLIAALSMLVITIVVGVTWLRRRLHAHRDDVGVAMRAARTLLAPEVLAVHLALSLLLVFIHTATFFALARGLGCHLEPEAAIWVVPPLLASSSIPLFLSGFGIREAVAAALYAACSLAPREGVIVSLAFGVLSLFASLPGVVTLWRKSE